MKVQRMPTSTTLEFEKFEHRAPALQNMLDIFQGRWATNCSFIAPGTTSGNVPFFTDDPRPRQAAEFFGGINGKRILELGPMEGAHTWLLSHLGAREVVAIEANAEALMKCLIVKELSGMQNVKFLYGDLIEYLSARPGGFDAIFCSGVMYHMTDPVNLIALMCACVDQVFVWTHYIRPDHPEDFGRGPGSLQQQVVERDGACYEYFVGQYGDRRNAMFLGGNEDTCAWMSLEGIQKAFDRSGFDISIVSLEENHFNGPAVTFGARRRPFSTP